MPRSLEPPESPAPGLCYRRGAGRGSTRECVLQPPPEVGEPRRLGAAREGPQASHPAQPHGEGTRRVLAGRVRGGPGRQLRSRLRGGGPWPRRGFVGAVVPEQAQPWHPQVGESWSCVPGSPAWRARGRWGTLPRSWVLGWVFWVARQGEGGTLGSVLSLWMGGRAGEKDRERRRETYPSLYKDTHTEKLILKHTEYTKRQKQKETRIQTDYGERQQKLRESPYTLRETHSDA